MAPRDGDGTVMPRMVTSCASCLAWGLTYCQGICLACYNFAAKRYRHEVGRCGACQREQPLKQGYCRLCWCQAREDRLLHADDARSAVVIAPHLPLVRHHQLFLAIGAKRVAAPRIAPRRYGVKGRPRKPAPPVAAEPRSGWWQPPLFDDPVREYRDRQFDLRRGPAPDNPWLAWALHLAHRIAETRGWDSVVWRAMQRTLVVLLANHTDGDIVRASDIAQVAQRNSTGVDHAVEILHLMGIVIDDRPRTFDLWLHAKLDELTPTFRRDIETWARVLHDGGPRTPARSPGTATIYVNAVRPALLRWQASYHHLREVTRDDIIAYVDTLTGHPRMTAGCALRSLFAWAKRNKVVFADPAARLKLGRAPRIMWQPLHPDDVADTVRAATTVQARLFVALTAVHAARPGHIRAMQLGDVDLAGRRITIAGRDRPLDDLTYRAIVDWLEHRRTRWPNTANQHLVISFHTANELGPVSATYLAPALRGLPATLQRLRIDRQLEEALATGGDPLQVAEVFGLSEDAAVRYAINALALLHHHSTDQSAVHP